MHTSNLNIIANILSQHYNTEYKWDVSKPEFLIGYAYRIYPTTSDKFPEYTLNIALVAILTNVDSGLRAVISMPTFDKQELTNFEYLING